MKIGISTACFYPTLTEDTLPVIAELGADNMEVFLNAPAEAEEEYCRQLRATADRFGLQVVSLHPYCGAYEYFNLFSLYERRREYALEEYRKMTVAAHILGAKYITFHGDRRNLPKNASMEMYCDSLKHIMDMAAEQGVELAQENVSWCRSSEPEFLREVDRNLGPYGLRYTLDIKQARRAGHSWQTYLDIMGSRLVNLHLSDGDDNHSCLIPGEGNIDFCQLNQALKGIGYQGGTLLEVYRENYRRTDELKKGMEYLRINMK